MSNSIPPLFGRVTAVLGEHAHLHETLDRLGDLIAALGDDGEPRALDPLHLLDEFRTEIIAHFAAEEDEGYFGTVAAESDTLSAGVARLEAEHGAIIAAVDGLRGMSVDTDARSELAHCLAELLDRFKAHERSESLLLQEFFLRDATGGKV